jgi:acyl carrier protein
VRNAVLDRIERSGVSSIDINSGLKTLECLLATGASQAAVLPIDWSKFSGRGRLFAGLDAQRDRSALPTVNALVAARQWRETWKAALPNRQRALIQDLASEEAARILGLAPTQVIDLRQPLQELGLDSLMAVQFRNRLSSWTGMELPATLLYSFPTLEQLVEHLTVSLVPDRQPRLGQSDELIQPSEMDLDALSEDELARMLEQQIKLA